MVTVATDASLDEANKILIKTSVRRLPVIDDERCVGVLLRRDVVRFIRDDRAARSRLPWTRPEDHGDRGLPAVTAVLDRTLGTPPPAVAIDVGVACESCPQMMTPEELRAKLADIAERLGVKDALDAGSEIRQAQQELLNEPEYLEFQRQRALEADADSVGQTGE